MPRTEAVPQPVGINGLQGSPLLIGGDIDREYSEFFCPAIEERTIGDPVTMYSCLGSTRDLILKPLRM